MSKIDDIGIVVQGGAGCFLNPPTHPEHNYHVVSKKRDLFFMSLSGAIESDWINKECKEKASKLINEWEKPSLESEEIQDWIYHSMGYFANCYTKDPTDRNVNSDNFYVDNSLDPIENQDYHLGVLHVRSYYPEFILTSEHVKKAYWGTKKN